MVYLRVTAAILSVTIVSASSAALLGSYTFNDNTDATQFVVGNLLDASGVAAGAGLSDLGVNPAIAYAGGNNVPPSGTGTGDGFGFGGHVGEAVMFWHRAALDAQGAPVPSLWGNASDAKTPVSEAPMNFTVSADPGFQVTVESVLVESVNTPAGINYFQVAGGTLGTDYTSTGGLYKENEVLLDAPVVIPGGSALTFTLLWNSGAYDQTHKVNQIDVQGSVVPEPASALLVLLGGLLARRRR